jgi:hypothetical protein
MLLLIINKKETHNRNYDSEKTITILQHQPRYLHLTVE